MTKKLYSMKETCTLTNLTYDTLKFYCNKDLIPNVKRDKNNYRVFDDKDINWIKNISCLKKCNMSIKEIKEYLILCQKGIDTIPSRKELLNRKLKDLEAKQQELKESINFINWKQSLYDDILSGKVTY